ncbi:MAG: hypothetical protein FWE28_10155 [Oscillospiraceae bacterium]|nr:hypothetical protein [Oscillospiraceae bacterium]
MKKRLILFIIGLCLMLLAGCAAAGDSGGEGAGEFDFSPVHPVLESLSLDDDHVCDTCDCNPHSREREPINYIPYGDTSNFFGINGVRYVLREHTFQDFYAAGFELAYRWDDMMIEPFLGAEAEVLQDGEQTGLRIRGMNFHGEAIAREYLLVTSIELDFGEEGQPNSTLEYHVFGGLILNYSTPEDVIALFGDPTSRSPLGGGEQFGYTVDLAEYGIPMFTHVRFAFKDDVLYKFGMFN